MPYARPTLTDLRNQIWSDITGAAGLVVSLLQKAVLKIVGSALAALVFGLYGYLDWIAKQAVPFTAEDEFLAGWGALKDVYLKAATQAVLQAQFTGAEPGTPLDAGTLITRADTFSYITTENAVVDATGNVTVTMQAVTAGSAGNCDAGTAVTLSSAVPGIPSTGTVTATITAGADVETQDEYRARVMEAFQQPAQGGAQNDYVEWALAIPGVTRAWCAPNGFGAGTVVLYFMMDDVESAHSGFPQGTDGVSQHDQGPGGVPRGAVATGDQLTVADAIVTMQPVTALVYACSPIENQIGFVIGGLASAGSATQDAVKAAISDVFYRNGKPGGAINLSDISSAISSVSGTEGFLLNSITSTVNGVTTTYPANTNITNGTGQLPVLGTCTFV
ncbi:baseplate J/gp47 family protein [Burkholderia multivorans]|uniref:baseplate J/gp47 family protein n=1 Tax=Burkholderia multivorans TaxID=87883 RepID=UPI00066997DF|nr:baseplate J/gp47 family protein [Burkholderia multivorans]